MELTDTDVQIIEYIAKGLENSEIAAIMGLKNEIFYALINKLFDKFGVLGEKNERVRLLVKYYREFDKKTYGKKSYSMPNIK